MSKLSVIVPVYNRRDLTKKFLLSICKYISGHEIIIVDNNSKERLEETINTISHIYPKVEIKLIRLETNEGFSEGNNIGVRNSTGEFVLFISNDVEVEGDCIKPLLAELENDSTSIFGHRLIQFATGWNEFNELSEPISYLEGYFIAMRKDTFNKLGGWDKTMWIDFSDIDLSYVAKINQYNLKQLRFPFVSHLHNGSTCNTQLDGGRTPYTLKDRKSFLDKWGFTIK